MPIQLADIDRVLHAIADPTRRGVIERLSRGPASVTELASPTTMALPSFLQHLKLLETNGLVRTEKIGRVRQCSLAPGALSGLERWVADRRDAWEHRYDRLGDLLDEEDE